METLSYCQLMQRCLVAEAERDALAAENAALKSFCKNAAFDADYEAELSMDTGGFTDALNNLKTPATDAFLREQMAKGIMLAITVAFKDGVPENRMSFIAKMIDYAAQLRAGEAL